MAKERLFDVDQTRPVDKLATKIQKRLKLPRDEQVKLMGDLTEFLRDQELQFVPYTGSMHPMTEWLKLERLSRNDLPLPKYESEVSAGVDFAACLTRPCKHIPQGKTHKEAVQFVVCEPTLTGSYLGRWPTISAALPASELRAFDSLKRHNVGDNWQEIRQTDTPTLAIMPRETVMIPLGFKSEFGSSYVLNLHVRSSVGLSGLILANGTGIIDPDYRGELFAAIYNRNDVPIIVKHGQRIVQGVMLHFNQAIIDEAEVSDTERGEGGFGSTGEQVMSDKPTQVNQPPELQKTVPPTEAYGTVESSGENRREPPEGRGAKEGDKLVLPDKVKAVSLDESGKAGCPPSG
jgi:dUTP pyrophosphatase